MSLALLLVGLAGRAPAATVPYPVVGTGQTLTYDNIRLIPSPQKGQPFFGQDGQQPSTAPAYRDHAFPHGRGPQGDVTRINNFVRLVRGGTSP